MRRTFALVTIALMLMLTGLATSILARQTSQQPDVLNALLVEVRGLRAAMEELASAGPRVQLSMGRLQLQEAAYQHARAASGRRARSPHRRRNGSVERTERDLRSGGCDPP